MNIIKTFNIVLEEGECPKEWQTSLYVLIYKKKTPWILTIIEEFFLINTLLKLLTKFLAERLQIVSKTFNLIIKEVDGLLLLVNAQVKLLVSEISQRRKFIGKNNYLCFFDIKKHII